MACMAGARDQVDSHRLEPRGKGLSARQETVETQLLRREATPWDIAMHGCAAVTNVSKNSAAGGHGAEHQENRSAAEPHAAFSVGTVSA
jgi:hypothetical protein